MRSHSLCCDGVSVMELSGFDVTGAGGSLTSRDVVFDLGFVTLLPIAGCSKARLTRIEGELVRLRESW